MTSKVLDFLFSNRNNRPNSGYTINVLLDSNSSNRIKFDAYLNGNKVKAILDTGAVTFSWIASRSQLLARTSKKLDGYRIIRGFGNILDHNDESESVNVSNNKDKFKDDSGGIKCDLYGGKIALYDCVNNEKSITFSCAQIAFSPLRYADAQLIIPYTAISDFDFQHILDNDGIRMLRINTRLDKSFFKLKYDEKHDIVGKSTFLEEIDDTEKAT